MTPITVRGRTFPSLSACARHFSISPATVHKAVENDRIDYIGLGRNRARPTTIDGVTYPSINTASRALKINLSTLQKRLAKS